MTENSNPERTVVMSVFPADYDRLNDILLAAHNTGNKTGYTSSETAAWINITAVFGTVDAKNNFLRSIGSITWRSQPKIHHQ